MNDFQIPSQTCQTIEWAKGGSYTPWDVGYRNLVVKFSVIQRKNDLNFSDLGWKFIFFGNPCELWFTQISEKWKKRTLSPLQFSISPTPTHNFGPGSNMGRICKAVLSFWIGNRKRGIKVKIQSWDTKPTFQRHFAALSWTTSYHQP